MSPRIDFWHSTGSTTKVTTARRPPHGKWAAARSRPAARKASTIAAGDRGAARSQSVMVSPWISSIAMKSRPAAVPASYTVTTFGDSGELTRRRISPKLGS
jgi:hypothetical protein